MVLNSKLLHACQNQNLQDLQNFQNCLGIVCSPSKMKTESEFTELAEFPKSPRDVVLTIQNEFTEFNTRIGSVNSANSALFCPPLSESEFPGFAEFPKLSGDAAFTIQNENTEFNTRIGSVNSANSALFCPPYVESEFPGFAEFPKLSGDAVLSNPSTPPFTIQNENTEFNTPIGSVNSANSALFLPPYVETETYDSARNTRLRSC